mgnify:CR=1 FL=1
MKITSVNSTGLLEVTEMGTKAKWLAGITIKSTVNNSDSEC